MDIEAVDVAVEDLLRVEVTYDQGNAVFVSMNIFLSSKSQLGGVRKEGALGWKSGPCACLVFCRQNPCVHCKALVCILRRIDVREELFLRGVG